MSESVKRLTSRNRISRPVERALGIKILKLKIEILGIFVLCQGYRLYYGVISVREYSYAHIRGAFGNGKISGASRKTVCRAHIKLNIHRRPIAGICDIVYISARGIVAVGKQLSGSV